MSSFDYAEKDLGIHTLDLNFMGIRGAIAVYLIPHTHGAVLVESGPASTIPALEAGLESHNLTPADVTDVFVTHIHLDHAGAAGWLARHGARIHVHSLGAPHLFSPEKLLASAKRLYGEMMDTLWGEFLPVPADKLSVLQDGEVVEVSGLRFRAIDTSGHAEHHFAYLFNSVCFSGDIGGVRLQGYQHLRLPTPPPEFHPEKWRASLKRLRREQIDFIAPTHFGLFADAERHFAAIENALVEVEQWMREVMSADPPIETLTAQFLEWTRARSLAEGLDEQTMQAYELANPSWMSPLGIQRYWRKYGFRKTDSMI